MPSSRPIPVKEYGSSFLVLFVNASVHRWTFCGRNPLKFTGLSFEFRMDLSPVEAAPTI